MKEIEIAGRKIGPNHPVFIVAEAGVNHNGSLEMAKQLVDVAVKAGADAVKFQTFKAEKLVSPQAPKASYQLKTTDPNESQLEMLKSLELTSDAFREVHSYCQKKGILFFSTPFDEESVDFLDELGVPVFKIASGEITNRPFLEYIAHKRKPIILSTGMSYLKEVENAVKVIHETGCNQLALLHCVSSYPADSDDANLRAIQTMASFFKVPIGFSDHTLGIETALAAVALGACVVEKHLTLEKTLSGPDHQASLEPQEYGTLVRSIRIVEKALGTGRKKPVQKEEEMRVVGRRSIVASRTIDQGATITWEMLTAKRPGNGLSPSRAFRIIGKKARTQIVKGTSISSKQIG